MRDPCIMDPAQTQNRTETPTGDALPGEATQGFEVESSLQPDLPISEAEIDAILRLLGDDLAKLLG